MKVKYVHDRRDEEFTIGKEYEFQVKEYGIEIIDDLNNQHVIATNNNKYKRYEHDEFFMSRFEFCD
jgi:hypothetical protein